MKMLEENFIFPSKHIPPCFTNKPTIDILDSLLDYFGDLNGLLSNYYEVQNDLIKDFNGFRDNKFGLKKGTEPIQLNISKPNGGNRIISIPNPVALLPLHFYVNQFSDDILYEQEDDSSTFISSSKFFVEEGQIVTQYGYDDYEVEETRELNQDDYSAKFLKSHKICDGKYYHLSIDITNFYNSIYTHTISWDLKDKSKKNIFDNLDILTRTMNFNETKGILIGPYTSSLFSELILSKIDRAIANSCLENDISYMRYCDDFDLYCDSKEVLEITIKKIIGEELSRYKLDLNMDKMKLEEFPFISLNTIQNKNTFLLLERTKSSNYKDSLEFIENIMNEINNSLHIKYSNCNYLLKILISLFEDDQVPDMYLDNETSEILLDFLVNMMFKNNLLSANISHLIKIIIEKSDLDRLIIIEKWIKKRNNRKSHIKEISDLWLAYLILALDVESDQIDNYMIILLNNGDMSTILSLEYFMHNSKAELYKCKIKETLQSIEDELKTRFQTNWINASYYSKYWLLFYINSLRWKYHEITGYKDTLLKKLYLPELYIAHPKEMKIFKCLYDNEVELVHFSYDE